MGERRNQMIDNNKINGSYVETKRKEEIVKSPKYVKGDSNILHMSFKG